MSVKKTERFGAFVESNLGAIMGNFMFGVFLGSTATIGYIFGLPLDIRHIAFSSANFAHGIFNIPADYFSISLVLISLLGVALIGIINLMVSFSLALMVALRSKGVEFSEWKTLGHLLLNHMVTNTRDFFWPRPEPMQYAHINEQGQMIYEDSDDSSHTANSPSNAVSADIQSKSAVRHLSEIQVLPKGMTIDKDKIDEIKQKKQLQQNLASADVKEVNPKPAKKVILTNDIPENLMQNKIHNGDKVTDKQATDKPDSQVSSPHKTSRPAELTSVDKHNELSSEQQTSNNKSMSSQEQADKKHSLPKPKKPPNLPN